MISGRDTTKAGVELIELTTGVKYIELISLVEHTKAGGLCFRVEGEPVTGIVGNGLYFPLTVDLVVYQRLHICERWVVHPLGRLRLQQILIALLSCANEIGKLAVL